jgi:hypothetical protein
MAEEPFSPFSKEEVISYDHSKAVSPEPRAARCLSKEDSRLREDRNTQDTGIQRWPEPTPSTATASIK